MLNRDLAALVGSRICHDLTSPLGAIGNGVELLELTGAAAGPEMALIQESVANAAARLRFFRIAFGAASTDQPMRRSEVAQVLAAVSRGGRVAYHWDSAADPSRTEVRCAFLAFLCMETGLPGGGEVRASQGGGWRIEGRGKTLRAEGPLWDALAGKVPLAEITAAQVQFALLPAALAELNRSLQIETPGDRIVLAF